MVDIVEQWNVKGVGTIEPVTWVDEAKRRRGTVRSKPRW